MNIIACSAWVKRGVSAAVPDKVQLSPEELEGIIKQTSADIENLDANSDSETEETTEPRAGQPSNDDEFNFENYDNESGDIHCTMGGLAVLNADGKDPFITVGESEDEDSEKEDDIIKPDDNLVLLGHVEGDASILEVFVYNEKEDSFYCHHDILLSSFPLCFEWLNFDPSEPKPGNFCAIGSMEPIIEVWDLDLVDCLEPAFKLGCKPSKKKKLKRIGHSDAVLDISWNINFSHILASGSVDQTVLLWDLENGTPATKYDNFDEKVQALQWHPKESQHLLTGCADHKTRLFDCRVDDNVKLWETTGEIERVLWNHFDSNYFFVSTSTGVIECIDLRQEKHVWEVKAHETEITGLSLSSSCPGLLVSSSNDGMMKVWDIADPKILQPVWEKKLELGALQCLAANPDCPFVFVLGGDNKSHNVRVIDLKKSSSDVVSRFGDRELIKLSNPTDESSENVMEVADDMESMALDNNLKNKKNNK